jgi:protein-S-isoprenylcysteine O-methyltransferase Ste14
VQTLNRYGANAIARQIFTPLLMSVLLFWAAGSTDWYWGWVFSVVHFLTWLGLSLVLWRVNPGLLNERGKRSVKQDGTKSWDRVVVALYFALLLIQPLVAGLDRRYRWSEEAAPGVHIVGNMLIILGMVILTWAMANNTFFEATVRIQQQRGHHVASAGPYRYVRHPGYSGVILTLIGLPVALAAWTALIPGLAGVILFVVRTALEDRTLQAELPGYSEYAQHTRYRLLPGIW